LSVVYLVNSGSEANELALRLARAYTDRWDIVTMDWGYHGNTGALVDISPYKFRRKGGRGQRRWVHVCDLPDPCGPHGNDGAAYAASVARCCAEARSRPGAHDGAAAFIAESISGCGGQVVLADGFLSAAYHHARAAGAVCIADEVQVGLGRVGPAMWGFAEHGVRPDIVTLGKPIGNGHPLGAVVTTPAIADAFANGMEWFNTFGGNPVSCAVGNAVLDVVLSERLPENAATVGAVLLDALRAIDHPLIADVRGRGLYIGVELADAVGPATAAAAEVINRLRHRGVLVSTDGPNDNVLKIKPPIVFSHDDAATLVAELRLALW
jgi:4-aminobutyrate aminotransferase-like enzyme